MRNMKKLSIWCTAAVAVLLAGCGDGPKDVAAPSGNKARVGEAERFYRMGYDYFEKFDFEESLRCYRKAAALGSAKALCEIGMFYHKGLLVEKDEKLAGKYFGEAEPGLLKLAKEGDAKAKLDLSFCYAHFLALEKYWYWRDKALAGFRAAAERGDAESQFQHALFLQDDDPAEALKWLRKASEQGYAKATFAIGIAYGNGLGVKQNEEEAMKWFHLAAERGYPPAEIAIAEYFEYEKKDLPEALKWYRRAAERGDKLAERLLREHEKAAEEPKK